MPVVSGTIVVYVPPVASEVKGPSVVVVPLGVVSTIVIFVAPSLVSRGDARNMSSVTVWPTPAGLGAMLRKAYDGTVDPAGGVISANCPFTGTKVNEAIIEIIRNAAINIVRVLFFNVFIFFRFL